MILVIDSNRVIAGLLKDSTSRRIIFHREFEFYSPEYLVTEITKYRPYLASKLNRSEEEVDIILYTLLDNITLLPFEEFEGYMEKAINIMKDIDIKDVPFLAVGLAINADGIWTEDKHFLRQNAIRIYNTAELTDMMRGRKR
jgi:predicted nucleic acid-binding protein